jgi:hypothetical protein
VPVKCTVTGDLFQLLFGNGARVLEATGATVSRLFVTELVAVPASPVAARLDPLAGD